MKKTNKINIGITINISDPQESLFTNGIRQNVILLRELYEKCNNVEKSYIINVTNVKIEENSQSPLAPYAKHIINLQEAKEKCDLIVVCHGSLHLNEYEEFSKLGVKFVKQVLGSQQSIFTESILFKKENWGIYKRNNFIKKVWISEHFYENEKHFHETLFNCEVKIAPYVWSPRFIEQYAEQLGKEMGKSCVYETINKPSKRLSSFEPNINNVKNCVIPIMITEKFYRKYPNLLERCNIFNSNELKVKPDFIDFCKDLDSHKNGKLFFEGGYVVINSLAKYTDIVISHQQGCALNYLYLDAAWFGYPILHNSHLMKELGWYYPENNVDKAVEQLHKIITTFDKNKNNYLKKSRKYAEKYFIDNIENIKIYETLIEELID